MTGLPERLLDSPLGPSVAARWSELRTTLTGPVVTRFAPSPTGRLHLGHFEHLRWLHAIAGLGGARVLVRIEDHDRRRCTPGFEAAILDDLAWLGFQVDSGSLDSLLSGHPSPWRQSDHPERYAAEFARLRAAGLLYGCTCTRGDLGPSDENGERHYPGTCRGQPIERDGANVVRLQLPDQTVVVEDLLLGTLHQHPLHDHGDPVIRDARGQWTYQFSVVVDDLFDDVNLIIRGADLVASTGRQHLMAALVGRTTPFITAHHPLLLDAEGRKLSKRDRSTALRPDTG